MRLWPRPREAPHDGASPPAPPPPPSSAAATTLTPHTGNRRLDRQLRALHERELREVPPPTVATPQLAARARGIMLDACGGRAPRPPEDSDEERDRDAFLGSYFTRQKMEELPALEAGADEGGGVWKHLQVLAFYCVAGRALMRGAEAYSLEPVGAAAGPGHGADILAGGGGAGGHDDQGADKE
jgi:hypothetical protein